MLMGTGPSCTEVVDEVKVRESRRSTGKSDTVCDIRSDSGSISGAKVGTDMNQFFFFISHNCIHHPNKGIPRA